MRRVFATSITAVAAVSLMLGQGAVPFPNPRLGNPGPPQVPPTPAQQTPPQPAPAQPTPQQPAPNAPATPNAAAPAPQANQAPPANPPAAPAAPPAPTPAAAPLADNGAFMVPGASLTEMIDILAKRLRINYILDPRVKGTVTIYTYGEVKPVDEMQILQTILRVNGATMVKVGD